MITTEEFKKDVLILAKEVEELTPGKFIFRQ